VAQASRFVPAAEMKKVKEGLADGTVDIVVGTHALLGKSIKFRDLALSSWTRSSISASATRSA
jgi:transcription-repair coupling factor (superfamily II helicase)